MTFGSDANDDEDDQDDGERHIPCFLPFSPVSLLLFLASDHSGAGNGCRSLQQLCNRHHESEEGKEGEMTPCSSLSRLVEAGVN